MLRLKHKYLPILVGIMLIVGLAFLYQTTEASNVETSKEADSSLPNDVGGNPSKEADSSLPNQVDNVGNPAKDADSSLPNSIGIIN